MILEHNRMKLKYSAAPNAGFLSSKIVKATFSRVDHKSHSIAAFLVFPPAVTSPQGTNQETHPHQEARLHF